MVNKTFSQITLAASPPGRFDQFVGVRNGNTDVLFTVDQMLQAFAAAGTGGGGGGGGNGGGGNGGGGGGVVPIAPVVTIAPQSSLIVRPGPGNMFAAYAINLSPVSGYLLVFDSSIVPADGPVTPIAATILPGLGQAVIAGADNAPIQCFEGVVVVLSSAISPFTQTTTGGMAGYISCQVQ